MMVTLFGLPLSFHYKDVKALIRTQCEIVDFILDNLSVEAGFKKIRVGLATDSEGNHLVKCLDGFQLQGCMLKVVPIVKTQNSSEPAPTVNYQREMVPPSYNAVQPNPWANQEPQWQGNPVESHGMYQQNFPQSQPYVQSQPHQTIPIVNRQPSSRFQTQQNYDKPATIMKDNFQGPQYVHQQNQASQFQAPQESWTPQMQQSQQFNQVSNKVNYNRQFRECDVQSEPIESNYINKVPGTAFAHSQFGPPSNRQDPQQITGLGMPSDRRASPRRGELRRVSPARILPEQRISPSRARGPLRNTSPPDRRREVGHNRRISPSHHSPSGRPVLLSGQYDSPSGLAPRHISPAGRQMPQGGRHISPPERQMPHGGRHISPPGRQMPQSGRHISPPGRQMPHGGRHISPPGRQMPQGGRNISPLGRQMPQGGRNISPSGRQMLQGGRNISPPGRQMPQDGRHISPPRRQMLQGRRHISPPGRQIPQGGRHVSPSGREMPQGGRHISPPGRQMPQSSGHIMPPGRQMPQGSGHILPPGRQMLQGGRHTSPPGRQMSQGGRHISPPGRQMLQGGRHISPPGRQTSQGGGHTLPHGRQIPEGGRHISPPGRYNMPQGERYVSPPRRQILQSGRHISPPARQMPQVSRQISPPGRQVLLSAPSSGRQVLPGRLGSPPPRIQISRQVSPPSRHVPHPNQKSPGRQIEVRRVSPTWRRISPSGRQVLIPGRNVSPSGRFSPPGRTVLITERRMSPGRRVIQTGRQMSPSRPLLPNDRRSPHRAMQSSRGVSPGRRISPTGRRMSPPGRHISPPGRRISPSGRRKSPPGRRMSPSGRRMSPPGRRISPSGRRMSPPGRRISPSGRRISPSGRRISPSGRLRQHSPEIRRASPMRPDLRQHARYSPSQSKPMGKYDHLDARSSFKHNMPQYDKASDQGNYSSAFRPNVREDKPYPRNSPPRESRWQEREQFPARNADRSLGPHKNELNRFSEQQRGKEEKQKSRSLTRESIRDRSPIRGFKRHSPSPRSPRRSWALEKRHSPDVKEPPPPPIWPGQDSHFQRRPHYPDRSQKEEPWQNKMDERHRGHPSFEEKDSISNWKPHPTDRSPQRFAESQRNKFESKQINKDDTYYREREKPRDFPNCGDGRQNFEVRQHNFFKNEEASRYPGQYAGKQSFQQQGAYKEMKQDIYTDDKIRNAPREIIPKYQNTPDRNPKDYKNEDPNDRPSNFNKKALMEIKEKRSKAAVEIATKIMERCGSKIAGKRRAYVFEELKAEVGRLLFKMFHNKDVPFVENFVKYDAKNSKFYAGIFARASTRLVDEIKKKTWQKPGNFSQRVRENQPQKRPQPTAKPQPAKVAKRDDTHIQIKEEKAAKPSQAPKQPQITPKQPQIVPKQPQIAPKQPQIAPMQPQIAPKQPQVPSKQPEKTQAATKPTPKPVQVEAKPAPTKKIEPQPSAVKESPKIIPENKIKVEPKPADAPKAEAKRQSGEIKVLSVAEINRQTERSQDVPDTKAEVKGDDEETKTEDSAGGNYFELNDLMSNVLKKELRGIMDKEPVSANVCNDLEQLENVFLCRRVWSCLMVQPDTPAEAMALDLIRYEGVDDIRDAIGLNVTKRLLNVFNPLLVKIQFSCRPENGCLTTFLTQHNIKSFKRIPNVDNTFVAHMQDIADFESLCFTGDIKCGSADLKITPCYKFTQCPPNLKLNLDDDDYYVYPTDDEYDDENDQNDGQMFDEFDKENPTENVQAASANDKVNAQSKPESQNVKDSKSKSDGGTNVEVNKSTVQKTKASVEKSVDKTKGIPSKGVTNEKTEGVGKVEKNNQKPVAAPTTAKASPTNKGVNNKSNKCVTNKKSNDNITKNKAKSMSQVKHNNASQTQKRKQSGSNNDVRRKIVKPKPKRNKRNTYKVIDEAFDDNDDEELDDKDILALLSGGVVLDECGSDD